MINKMSGTSRIEAISRIAVEAGEKIMEIRRTQREDVRYKADASPVTEADLAANEWIVTRLEMLDIAPIVSEESSPDIAVPDHFWLVDPLDGTKDFVAGKDTFVVNIALVEAGRPVLGVVFAPALGELFWAELGKGAYKGKAFSSTATQIRNVSQRERLRVLASGSHMTPRLQSFIDLLQVEDLTRYGSALKMCRVAEGVADLYPRLGGTSEWDTAAGQMLLEESGCKTLDLTTGKTLRYGKPQFRNPGFVAARADLDFVDFFNGQGFSGQIKE
jgi:3'(2'), 5'-bisphosphate nucleotidase